MAKLRAIGVIWELLLTSIFTCPYDLWALMLSGLGVLFVSYHLL